MDIGKEPCGPDVVEIGDLKFCGNRISLRMSRPVTGTRKRMAAHKYKNLNETLSK